MTGTAARIRSAPRPGRECGNRLRRRSRRCSNPSSRTWRRSRSAIARSSCRSPPPRLASRRYARDYNEVKLVGQDTSGARTADQTHLAHFWVEPSPSGWSRVGNLVSARYGYDLHRTARLQALLNMAMADGFIVGWFQKRHFAFWRPVTAIRKGDTDGNRATKPDPSWLSLRPTPPLPDYPSTHSLLGGAAAEILRRFTGTSAVPVLHGLDDVGAARERSVAGIRSRRPNWRTPSRACWWASTSAPRSRPASRSAARSGGTRSGMRCSRSHDARGPGASRNARRLGRTRPEPSRRGG